MNESTWEMPEIQYPGEFTTLLPKNDLLAHVMNCDACERSNTVNYALASMFNLTARILTHENNRANAHQFAHMNSIRDEIVRLEKREADAYAQVIYHVNENHPCQMCQGFSHVHDEFCRYLDPCH